MANKFITSIQKAASVIKDAVVLAEGLWEGYDKAGEAKKQFVVDLLNERIDLPFIGEKTEEKLLSLIIDVIVELVLPKD